ncbi:uncharacterized protein LOC117011197 [Catharus ustulatus]|uniref:uncharacterized protein LOC117011197 n=1 Tax=Catharus ustulatus TaxID=91951 RepID=UPI00140941AF|nr:uncharacterized protein LOC117011197 [Catharus ustulatus]
MKLRLELERGESFLRILESEMSFAQKDAQKQVDSAEDELHDAKTKLLELHVQQRGPRHQPFSYRSESPLDQSYSQDVQQPQAETDRAIEAMCHGTNTGSGTSLPSGSFCLSFVSEGTTTPRGPSPDESLCVHFGPEAAGSPPLLAPASPCDARTPPTHARDSDEYFQPQLVLKGAAAPVATETDDRVQVNVVQRTAHTPPPARAPCVRCGEPRHRSYTLSGTEITSGGTRCMTCPMSGTDTTSESFQIPFVPQGISTPCGPAHDARCGEPRQRSYTLSGNEIPSGGTLYKTCPMSGTNTASESLPSYFIPGGVSTAVGCVPNVRWGEPRDRCYTFSVTEIPSGGTLYRTCPMSGTNTASESLPNYFIPQGVSTPVGPAPPASGREPRDLHFSSGSESDLDQSYSQHFRPLRAADHSTPDVMRYASDTDLHHYWRPCPPPLPSFLFPSCWRGRSYNSPGPSGTYVSVMPSVMNTSSKLDSSCIRPLSTFSFSIPSCWNGSGTGSSVNTSFSFRPRRSHSLPPFRSVSQDISSRRRRNQYGL